MRQNSKHVLLLECFHATQLITTVNKNCLSQTLSGRKCKAGLPYVIFAVMSYNLVGKTSWQLSIEYDCCFCIDTQVVVNCIVFSVLAIFKGLRTRHMVQWIITYFNFAHKIQYVATSVKWSSRDTKVSVPFTKSNAEKCVLSEIFIL